MLHLHAEPGPDPDHHAHHWSAVVPPRSWRRLRRGRYHPHPLPQV